jgi:hypothetical protein
VPLLEYFSLDQVVKLVSETFNYPRIDRQKARVKHAIMEQFPNLGRHFNRIGLRPKVTCHVFYYFYIILGSDVHWNMYICLKLFSL